MSKFKNILKAAKEREADNPEISSTPEPSAVEVDIEEDMVDQVTEPIEKPVVALDQKRSPSAETETQSLKRGRPKGKRSDPDYEQVTAYIKKETYRSTKIALLQQGDVQDFSGLIEKLLNEWLST